MKPAKAVAFLIVVCVFVVLASRRASSQQSHITQPIDQSKLMVLKGNVHPWAQSRFDRGAAPASLPMNQMMLVLRSTPGQMAQLHELLREQQDPTSANYHKWLTPEEFGDEFGTSEADIQKVTSWLTSQGFTIDSVANGRNIIEFSGNAAKVQSAFHAAIHKYVVNGNSYWANADDPSIPVALAPAVAGIASLNNFPRHAEHRFAGTFTRNKQGKLIPKAAANPQFTFAAGCNGTTSSGSLTDCYALTPYDFATIYNVLPLWTASTPINGSGQTIAIVSDTDINAADFTNFRSLFGLPAGTLTQIHTNTDPGVQPTGNESEADVDTQWSGAVAPGAKIDLVVSSDTSASFGGDLSAEYVIDGHDANNPKVIGYSYGECEFFLGTAGNQFYGGSPVQDVTGEWMQAATEGITVVVSTGDTGSTGCEAPTGNPPADEPAIYGLSVNGIASTPYNVAVGGTDFNDGPLATAETYWNSSNASTTQASVKGYIPEVAYNDSCLNAPLDALYDPSASTNGLTNCNTYEGSTSQFGFLVTPFGGGGGLSSCIGSNLTYNSQGTPSGAFSSCTGGYAKPSWQTALTPADTVRDLPDIAIFAGDGTFQNFYLYCQQDVSAAACSLTAGSSTSPYPDIQGIGGTSVSAEAFAGMMALLNQARGSAVGLPNQNLYALAAQPWANCTSSGTLNSGCVFYQVTSGSTAMPCVNPTSPQFGPALGCTVPSGDTIGETEVSGGTAAYDASNPATSFYATGLGSLNVYNLVNEWSVGSGGASDFVISASPVAVPISAPGGSGTTQVSIEAVNGFSDTVNLSCASASLPSGVTCSFGTSPLSAGSMTTLTINTTTSAGVPPSAHPDAFGSWRIPATLALGCVLTVSLLLFALRGKNRRWSVIATCFVFVVFMGVAGCGGGSSSSGGGSGNAIGPTAITITGTSTAGMVSHSTTIMLTVQ